MKFFFSLIMGLIFINCFSQDSVLLKGPYTPKSKYENDVIREISLSIRPEGDSAVISKMGQNGTLGTTVQNDTFRSHAVILTSKVNAHKRYSVATKMSLTGTKKTPFDYILLYGSAHTDSVPHIDSIGFQPAKPEFNTYKKQVFENFRNILNYLSPPNRYFHLGDTASIITVIPASMLGMRANFIILSTYKLTAIRKGSAYFDMSFKVKINFSSTKTVIMSAEGSGDGTGNFVYNIKKQYFPFNESNIVTKAVMQFYNPSDNQYIRLNLDQKMYSKITLQKVR